MKEAIIIAAVLYIILILLVWFIGWLVLDKYGNVNPKVQFILRWYDGWVGYFWDSKKKILYVFLIPYFGIVIKPYRKNFE